MERKRKPNIPIETQKILEGIKRGEKAVADGKLLSHEQAKTFMARWLLQK